MVILSIIITHANIFALVRSVLIIFISPHWSNLSIVFMPCTEAFVQGMFFF